MNKKWFQIFSITIILVLLLSLAPELNAQCPMCRMSAESNLAHGGTAGKGLNTGILYMLSMPYLLVLSLGIIWYKNRNKEDSSFDLN
jgi:hypothetical protein